MRRKDREVTHAEKIDQIIRDSSILRIGLVDQGIAYIVPLNFGFAYEKDHRTFYCHSAKEGRKITLIKASGPVGFEMDTAYTLHTSEIACECSASFQSIIGIGDITIIEDHDEKRHGLETIMKHNTHKEDWTFSDASIQRVTVFKLVVTELACKVHA